MSLSVSHNPNTGRMLAEMAGAEGVAVGITFASILSQLLVIAGGFYKTVTFPLFAWICHVNAIKYGFSAIAKIYFKSTDSFWVTPDRALSVRGYTWSSLEFMGAFTTLRTRGVTVVDSLDPPTIGLDIAMLIVLALGFRLLCFCVAVVKARSRRLPPMVQIWKALGVGARGKHGEGTSPTATKRASIIISDHLKSEVTTFKTSKEIQEALQSEAHNKERIELVEAFYSARTKTMSGRRSSMAMGIM